MFPDARQVKMLEEVREGACERCAAHCGGTCEPGETPCGTELPLAQLARAVVAAPADQLAAPLKAVRQKLGSTCASAPAAADCPCPPQQLAAFANAAAEEAERHHELRERLLDLWEGE